MLILLLFLTRWFVGKSYFSLMGLGRNNFDDKIGLGRNNKSAVVKKGVNRCVESGIELLWLL